MASHALNWLVKQYRSVLGRIRVREYLGTHPEKSLLSAPARGQRDVVERLEDRALLSSTDALVNGTDAAETLTIKKVTGNRVQVSGGSINQSFDLAAITSLTVD